MMHVMPVWLQALLAVAIVSAIPLASAVVFVLDPTVVRRAVPILVRLATGALVGAVLFDLIPEALAAGLHPTRVASLFVAGLIGFGLIDGILDRLASSQRVVWLNFAGDILHNAVDGVLIAASFLANPSLGIVATLAVSLHELPRELGSLGIFLHGGLPVARAYGLNALTGLSALAGASLMLLIGLRARGIATEIIPIAAGSFLYIAGFLLRSTPRPRLIDATWIVAGLAVTAFAGTL
jgi:zinc and cadmium transporter